MSKQTQTYWLAILFPLFVLAMQLADDTALLVALLLLIVAVVTAPKAKQELLLLLTMVCGYLLYKYAMLGLGYIAQGSRLGSEGALVLSRFALLGFILPFAIRQAVSRATTNYLGMGTAGATVKMPFVWYGFEDKVTRVGTVFSLLCILLAGICGVVNRLSVSLMLAGAVFAVVNSLLEELLWRGLVLGRTIDLLGERAGLLSMSLAFGFYHYSLGYSIPVCLAFSLGGVYFGAVAVRSGGLLLSIAMHASMNLLFVAIGIIF